MPSPTTCCTFDALCTHRHRQCTPCDGNVGRRINALRVGFHRRYLHALRGSAFLRLKIVQRQQRNNRHCQSAACMIKTDTAPRYCPSCVHVHPSRPGRGTIAIASPDNK
ncbi:hypothetical protein [Xanthomonas sp. BRIP62415]|uniref:hypothetical protein n=1 Tax=Xanthomonas sp. BRIP62415 TaxID=2182390 RepID=UPI0013DFF4DE|nr:hypothetical protein [Xanthomonas sp. BRIP62415]